MTGANPARGEAAIDVGGARLTLRPSFAALVAAEEELGPLFALVERAAAGGLRLGEIAALVLALPARSAGGLTRERIGEAIAERGLARATPALTAAAGPDPAGPCLGMTPARLAGLAGALLGWRPDEFWRATPAELAAVLERDDRRR